MMTEHDPGGKVRLNLIRGMAGAAQFSECKRYRHVLTRCWTNDIFANPVLWIGMNPSTADTHADDPTVRKEVKFSMRWGASGYIKCNVMDYRATKPRDLRNAGVPPRSAHNLPTIKEYAPRAERIVICYGVLHKTLQRYADETVAMLHGMGCKLWCFGLSKEGHPLHPLYQLDAAELVPFEVTQHG